MVECGRGTAALLEPRSTRGEARNCWGGCLYELGSSGGWSRHKRVVGGARAGFGTRAHTRVTAALRREVVTQYQAGQSTLSIAKTMGIGKATVLAILDREGVQKRFPRLSPEMCEEIAELYRGGMRQIDIAQKFGMHEGHVWQVLKRAGLVGK
jgi:transposase-like protein